MFDRRLLGLLTCAAARRVAPTVLALVVMLLPLRIESSGIPVGSTQNIAL